MNITAIKQTVGQLVGRTTLQIKKVSPEILLTVGIGGLVGAAVYACVNTLKLPEAIEKAETAKSEQEFVMKKRNEISSENSDIEYYSDAIYKKERMQINIEFAKDIAKLYGPPVTLGVASIACILGSYNIISKRNIALAAAYKTVEKSFSEYRKRVVDEYGEDVDYAFKNNLDKITTKKTVVNEDGTKQKVEETTFVKRPDNGEPSQYARFFDEASREWKKDAEMNLVYLKSAQNFMNDKLRIQGHLFLNEVYDYLDIPRSRAGSVVGWVLGEDNENYVDFGLFDGDSERVRRFINGDERTILLDFNVDGVIYDLI